MTVVKSLDPFSFKAEVLQNLFDFIWSKMENVSMLIDG